MHEAGGPLLAYDRIDANRRTTRLLQASLTVMLLPVVTAGAVVVVPVVSLLAGVLAYAVYGSGLEARIQSLQLATDARMPGEGFPGLLDLPRPLLAVVAGVLAVALAIAFLTLFVVCGLLISRYGSRTILRLAGARPVEPVREPGLVQVVENLCIGAGLPMPRLYVIESPAANAFAVGNTPSDAALAVTRGLLNLLDRRELEGVVAHELSHIGNHDIRSSTTLAAVVGTVSLPLRILTAPVRVAFSLNPLAGSLAALVWLWGFGLMVAAVWTGTRAFLGGELAQELPAFLRVWGLHAILAPAFAVLAAPVAALAIRQAVSRQREFLADADAVLLTRDPAGLALALVKTAASRGERLPIGEASLHLCFVDPGDAQASLLHRWFPSHPSMASRVDLLSRMGNGLDPAVVQAAWEVGTKGRVARSVVL